MCQGGEDELCIEVSDSKSVFINKSIFYNQTLKH